MYLDALSFLDDEREAWRPFEALTELTDEQLSRPVDAAHGWSGRDLMAHLVGWLEVALAAAKELAVNETSATFERIDAEFATRGDEMNAEIERDWRSLPMDEVRRRFRDAPGELRGYLTVVPETRWVKHPTNLESFMGETIEHYDDHRADLEAILAAVR